jgi:tetratricopeptide (TPR) repeat protein
MKTSSSFAPAVRVPVAAGAAAIGSADRDTPSIRLRMLVSIGMASLALAACADGHAPNKDLAEPFQAPQAESATNPIRTKVAEARLRLDQGKDQALSINDLEAVQSSLSPADAFEVNLVLGKLHASIGQKEKAADYLERALEVGSRDADEEAHEAFGKLLGRVTDTPRPTTIDNQVAKSARNLAKYFPGDKGGRVAIRIRSFGMSDDQNATFDIAKAANIVRREQCPICEPYKYSTSFSRQGLWTGIPSEKASLNNSLIVLFYDLERNHLPERYAYLLPTTAAKIDEELQKGNGYMSVREREGAPPIVLIAAPREGQLPDVEKAFANADHLPLEPQVVRLSAGLRSSEVQGAMRQTFPAVEACYKSLLQAKPEASGSLLLDFAVKGDGTPSNLKVETKGTLKDETFASCTEKALASLRFAKTSGTTTVRYPITLTP